MQTYLVQETPFLSWLIIGQKNYIWADITLFFILSYYGPVPKNYKWANRTPFFPILLWADKKLQMGQQKLQVVRLRDLINFYSIFIFRFSISPFTKNLYKRHHFILISTKCVVDTPLSCRLSLPICRALDMQFPKPDAIHKRHTTSI